MIIILAIGIVILLALLALKVYLDLTAGVCSSPKSLDGKVVIVTGANSGIGFETAKELARRNGRVILACRSMDRGNAAANKIIESTGNRNVVVRQLDVSSLASVRNFATEIIATEVKLDVLIHNAAHYPKPGLHLTKDGFEVQFATNHLGPFLLTYLLLDLLKRAAPSRIIVVSSITHLWATLDLENLNCEKQLRDPYWIYCTTKLANILFVRELSRRLEESRVTVNCLHPGGVRTSISRNSRWFIKYLIVPIVYPFLKSCKSGAQTTIYLAVAEVENITGQYFVDCKPARTSLLAKDDEMANKLWDISESLTGLKDDRFKKW